MQSTLGGDSAQRSKCVLDRPRVSRRLSKTPGPRQLLALEQPQEGGPAQEELHVAANRLAQSLLQRLVETAFSPSDKRAEGLTGRLLALPEDPLQHGGVELLLGAEEVVRGATGEAGSEGD